MKNAYLYITIFDILKHGCTFLLFKFFFILNKVY